MLRFGTILNDAPTIQVSLIGFTLNIGYISVFRYYTNNAKDNALAWKQMTYAGALLVAIIAYTFVEDPEVLPFRYGMTLTAILFFFVSLPLFKLVWTNLLEFVFYFINSNVQFYHFSEINYSQKEYRRFAIPHDFNRNVDFIFVVLTWSGVACTICYLSKWFLLFIECTTIIIVCYLSVQVIETG